MDRHQRNTLSGNEVRAALTLGSRSHVGMKRSTNQDAFCAMVGGNAPPGTDALLAVADGMGGHQAGEVASDMAIRGLVAKLSQSGAVSSTEDGYATALRRAFAEINSEIRAAATRPETRGMGTTLTAAVLAGDRLTVSHVGDSRAYLLRDGRLWQLTQDHSWVAEEVAKGRLTPQEAVEHPRRNILTQAMGIDSRVDPHSSTVPVLAKLSQSGAVSSTEDGYCHGASQSLAEINSVRRQEGRGSARKALRAGRVLVVTICSPRPMRAVQRARLWAILHRARRRWRGSGPRGDG